MLPKIIAVDFDGTLCENCYPDIGKPINFIINYLLEQQKQGTKIILWTCRMGKDLQEAIQFCEAHGLKFDAVNDNLPEAIEVFGGSNSRKIFAHVYLDDRAASPRDIILSYL